MKDDRKTTSGSEQLRRRAEERLPSRPVELKQLSPEEAQTLLQELQIHQVELEMQNEQLRQTQAELETALAKYTDLYDFSPVAYLTLDPNGWVLEANLTAARLLGTERSQLVQQPLATFIRPEDTKQFWAYLAAVAQGEVAPCLELNLLGKGGEEVTVQLDSVLVPNALGNPQVRISVTDVTWRRQAAEALCASEEKYRTVADYTYDMEYWIDQEGNIRYMSPACERLTGYPAQAFVADPHLLDRVVHPDDLSLFIKHMEEANSLTEHFDLYFRLVHQNGEEIWVVHTCQPVYGMDGSLLGRRVCNRDVTKKRQAEEAFRIVVDHAPMGIFIIQDGDFILVNPGFEAITGYSREELLGQKSQCLTTPEHKEVVRQEAIKRLKGESSTPFEFQFITKSGETRWGMESLTPTSYRGKQATLGYFLDITEHKHLEDQFLQAQKMEAVGRLAGGVAHDFNNLLMVIFGYSDLINEKLEAKDPLARYLNEIRKSSDRAAALTGQLLAFSRKTILALQIMNLNDQLPGIRKMLERLIGEDIELSLVLDPALGTVQADPGQIEQIVMNLAVNARDAMPRGGKLTLETVNVKIDEDHARKHQDLTPGPYVMLKVTDNGQGMDVETQARIFEPFFTTKELGRGTGLGLSTVYGLVKQGAGHIEIDSRIDHGTTFKVYLPRVQEEVTAVYETEPETRDLHGSEIIMVVEDEDMLRDLIYRSLRIYGYTVLTARHGGEALLLCEQHPGPIHVLLTDIVMPLMSGRELADRLRPLRPDMKVIYMSGYTENAIVHHGVLESDIFFMQKPFHVTKLLEKIREILS
jgi:two-component system, cell cycle sensor histidine kinase and response regulator CckA